VLAEAPDPLDSFLEYVSTATAIDLRTRERSGELESEDIELLHPVRSGSRAVSYSFRRVDSGWMLFGQDQSHQLELVSQMSVLIEDLETEMQRERALAGKLRALLSNDHLTGLANRRHIEEVLRARWESFIASGNHFAVVSIDIDHFKAVNDRFGHDIGDEVLRRVSRAIETSVRDVDVAARFGGEEFIVVTSPTTQDGAMKVAERIRARVQVSSMPHGVGQVTVSLGVASTGPAAPESPEHLLKLSDQALYAAKRNGRNRVEIATISAEASH